MNRATSERVSIKPVEGKGEPPLRFNWESPFIISPHNPSRLYFGTNKLLRSDDRGNSWRAMGADLTRQIDRDKIPVMGKVWPPEALLKSQSTSTYGNITALSESPKKQGLLYAGTDDGNIQVLDDEGGKWRKIEKFPTLPETSPYGVYVQRLLASRHGPDTVYALFDNHKNNDFKPYVLKSTDRGVNWASISGDLPANGPALSIAEDPVNPNLLFVGTEFGLFFTIDGGKKWVRLRGNLPTIPVRDLAIQDRENDLVLATFGRGFYVLDDITPLRLIQPDTFKKPAEIFPVRQATIYVQDTGRARGSQGEQLWFADNPPYGATFTYWLKDALKTKKQLRQDADRAAVAKKQEITYPSPAELTAEADEEAPQILLTITDSAGKVVKRVTGPATAGIQRVTWNLRGPAAVAAAPRGPLAGTGNDFGDTSGGGFVQPGTYKVAIARRVDGVTTPLGSEQSFTVDAEFGAVAKPADLKLLTDFQQKAYRLQRSVSGALEAANTARTQVAAMKRAILDSGADAKLLDEAASLEKRLTAIVRKLRGDETQRGLDSGAPSTIQSRVQSIAFGTRSMISAPTGTQQLNYQVAADEFTAEFVRLKAITDTDLKRFEQQLDAAGVPFTPGRMPEFRER